MTNWYTADPHFEHDNIIHYVNRPFDSVWYMNTTILNNINRKCKPDDYLYILGDFYMLGGGRGRKVNPIEYYWDAIKCNKRMILGNHDKNQQLLGDTVAIEIPSEIGQLRMTHHPEVSHKANYNLCGHVHDLWRVVKERKHFMVNVGLDMWNYEPISLDDIAKVVQNYKDFFSGNCTERPIINEREWVF